MTIDALNYLTDKYNLNLENKLPIRITPTGKQRLGRWYALPEIFCNLGFKRGAEIGVLAGKYSARLCAKIPGLKLFSIDPWLAYKGYGEHGRQSKMEDFYATAQGRIAKYDCELIRKFSLDAVKDFENESLDFVYIDGNHDFQNVANDIVEWEKKVRIGGIVAGHDYRRFKPHQAYKCHAYHVVIAYTYTHDIKPWFVLEGDKSPSWFWVKASYELS